MNDAVNNSVDGRINHLNDNDNSNKSEEQQGVIDVAMPLSKESQTNEVSSQLLHAWW